MAVNILERAQADFKRKLANGMKTVEVPEWGDPQGNPTVIYYRPAMTMSERIETTQLSQEGKLVEATVLTLILRARDEDGNRLFRKADRTELLKSVDGEVISRIVVEMRRGSEETEEGQDEGK